MAPCKKVPDVYIFSTRVGDVVVRPDVNCYLLLPSLPTSPCAELRPLHPSLRGGEHYFSSRWHNSIYIIRDNTFLEVPDLSANGEVKRLHPSCCGGQHYYIVGSCFVIILSPGTVTAVKDLTTGEPDVSLDLGHHQWSKEKMETRQSYLYWELWDNFTESFFTLNPNILNFLPGGLSLTKGPAFGAWKLLSTFCNYSSSPDRTTHRVFWMVGCAKEKLADVGQGWMASLPDSLELSSIPIELTKAQFALPPEYGGMGVNTEQEEWGDIYEEEKTLELFLQPDEMAYVWQYQLGLGKDVILFCGEVKVTYSSDPPSEVSLPSSS